MIHRPLRVLVTGSSGRVGGAIAALLAHLGHSVTGLDCQPGLATTRQGSITDTGAVRAAIRGTDVLVHCAALHAPHVGLRSDADFEAVNVDGTRRLLDAALAAGLRRVVLTSSTSVYGRALVPGDRAVWVDESLAPQPRDIYDRSKLAAEALAREAAAAGLPCVVLRMSRSFPEPLPRQLIHRLHRGVDLRDVAAGHVRALLHPTPGFALFNLSAASPFLPEDCLEMLHDAAAVIHRREPALAAVFATRGWPLPRSLDRVYAIDQAVAMLGYQPHHGWRCLLEEASSDGSDALRRAAR